MGLTLNTNIASLRANRAVRESESIVSTATERLATGLRINRAADDPAGLIAATSLESELVALSAEADADTRKYYALGFATSVYDGMQDIARELGSLVSRSANRDALSDAEKESIQLEIDAALDGMDQIGRMGRDVAARIFGGAIDVGIAFNGHFDLNTGQVYTLDDLRSDGVLSNGFNPEAAAALTEKLAGSIVQRRAELGIEMNHLERTGRVREITKENLTGALSQIRDTDYAIETMNLVRGQTLSRASLAAAAVANNTHRNTLALLGI